jgi:zinc protease
MVRKPASRIRILAAVLILLPVCFSQSRPNPQRSVPVRNRAPFLEQAALFEETPYVSKVVLKNGLTILVEEFKSNQLVSIQTYIRAGFLNETPGGHGAAQLIPSLVCRRPANKSSGTLEQNIYALGGVLRTAVNYEDTQFEIVTPAVQWKKALDLQAEALLNPSFEAADWMPEANLLVNAARSALDDPTELSREKLLELVFNPIRMGKYGEIAASGLHGLKSEEIAGFYKAFYAPSRMTLVLSGDVNSSEALNEIVRIYGKLAAGSKAAPVSQKAAQSGFRYHLLRGDVAIPQLLFGFRTVPENLLDSRALQVLSAVLGTGEGSILKYRLRDQGRLIWGEETAFLDNRSFDCLMMRVEMDPKDIDRSQIAVLTEIELLKRQELGEADLARAVAQLEIEHWKHMDRVTGRAETLAHFEFLGDWKGRDRFVSDLKKVSPADVKRVANRYLRLENCALLEYLPVAGNEQRNPTTESIRQTLEGLIAPAADELQAKRDKEISPFPKIPQNAESFRFSEIQYPFQIASILRGPEMLIREDHTAPVITMGIFFAGGKTAENKENAGITRLMTDLMAQGSPEMQASRFSQQLELCGGQVEPVVTDDYFGFNFSILSGNFDAGFNLLKQAIKTPVFGKEALDRQRNAQIREGLRRKASEANALDLVHQALFQGSSYSSNGLGTEAGLAGITPDSLLGWYNEYVKNRKPFVVIIGDTKGTSLALHFVKEFSGSRMQDVKLPEARVKPLAKGEVIEQGWKKNQSLIFIGFQAPSVDDEDCYAVTVLENLAGNLGRLSQEIRYKLEAAHEVSVRYEPRLRGGSLVACATTNSENEAIVLKAIREGLLSIAAGPNSYRDCRSAVNAAVGMYGILNQDRSEQIRRVVVNLMAGKGIAGFQDFPTALQNVNEDDLSEIAKRIFQLDKAVIVRMHGHED